MLLPLFPFIEEDHDEHRGHHKVEPLGVERDHIADDAAEHSAEHPVALVQQRDEEHEPAAVHVRRDHGRIVDGEGLVAHAEDQIGLLSACAFEFFQHGDAVEQVARLDHQRGKQRGEGGKGAEQHFGGDKFERAAVDAERHQRGVQERKAERAHI